MEQSCTDVLVSYCFEASIMDVNQKCTKNLKADDHLELVKQKLFISSSTSQRIQLNKLYIYCTFNNELNNCRTKKFKYTADRYRAIIST